MTRNPTSGAIAFILLLLMVCLVIFGVLTGLIRAVTAPVIERLDKIEDKVDGQGKVIRDMRKQKVTTDTIKKTIETLPQTYRDRARHYGWEQADRRGGNWIGRLDNYLEGTPLEGQGRTVYLAAVEHRVDPRLIVAIAAVESSKGRFLAGGHNAWGRKAVSGGWESWGSWEVAIADQAAYLARWGEKIWTSYCVPPENWGRKVRAEMARV